MHIAKKHYQSKGIESSQKGKELFCLCTQIHMILRVGVDNIVSQDSACNTL